MNPVFERQLQGAPPVLGVGFRQGRTFKGAGRGAHEVAQLEAAGSLLAQKVKRRFVANKLQNQVALSHPAPAVNRYETRLAGSVGLVEGREFLLAADKRFHDGPSFVPSLNLASLSLKTLSFASRTGGDDAEEERRLREHVGGGAGEVDGDGLVAGAGAGGDGVVPRRSRHRRSGSRAPCRPSPSSCCRRRCCG